MLYKPLRRCCRNKHVKNVRTDGLLGRGWVGREAAARNKDAEGDSGESGGQGRVTRPQRFCEGETLETAELGAERVSWSLLTVDDRR